MTIKIQPNYVFNCETVQYRVYRSQDGGGVFYRIAPLDLRFPTLAYRGPADRLPQLPLHKPLAARVRKRRSSP